MAPRRRLAIGAKPPKLEYIGFCFFRPAAEEGQEMQSLSAAPGVEPPKGQGKK
jgi:hypothetical protein